jgi:hypothetical protein
MSDPSDLDATDPDVEGDQAEQVDEDVIDGEYPPEHAVGSNERLTPAEEQVGESTRSRAAREVPEVFEADDDASYALRQLVAPGEDGLDDEDQEVALEADESGGYYDGTTQDGEEVQSAEEAAMHLTAEPPMHDSDGYVDEDDLD